jgi:tellurite resistance protein TerC
MWTGFVAFVIAMIAVDMLFLRVQDSHKVSVREAAAWSLLWVLLALAFNALFWWYLDGRLGLSVANERRSNS